MFRHPNQDHRLKDQIPITKKAVSSGGLARISRFVGTSARGDEAGLNYSFLVWILRAHLSIQKFHPEKSPEIVFLATNE